MRWVEAVAGLRRERRAGVLATVIDVRGHAPRDAGAKLVVAADATWGSVGGGNLEETVVVRCRRLIAEGGRAPEQLRLGLSEHARTDHGRQCCGGEVTVLLEPLPVVPAVAVFGVGHVGLELARVLCRHDLELHLVDSRADRLREDHLGALADAVAGVHLHHAPVPELALAGLPHGTHVRVMTHDHAEDFAVCDEALRMLVHDPARLASIGLIGSTAKWSRFRAGLLVEGHDAADVDLVRCPIGAPAVTGKEPAVVALSVATELLSTATADLPGDHR